MLDLIIYPTYTLNEKGEAVIKQDTQQPPEKRGEKACIKCGVIIDGAYTMKIKDDFSDYEYICYRCYIKDISS